MSTSHKWLRIGPNACANIGAGNRQGFRGVGGRKSVRKRTVGVHLRTSAGAGIKGRINSLLYLIQLFCDLSPFAHN